MYLASYPKSGNTWLRIFLANYLADLDKPVAINKLEWLGMTGGDLRADIWEHVTGQKLEDIPETDVPQHFRAVAEVLASRPGITPVKTHHALGKVHGHWTVPMELAAGAVYVVRDPRDVAISYAHHYGMSIDEAIEAMADPNCKIMKGGVYHFTSSWSAHVASWLDAGAFLLIYEKLRKNPEYHFARMVKYLGDKPNKRRIRKAVRFSQFDILQKQEQDATFIEQSSHNDNFFRAGKAGGWKETLSSEQARRIVDDHQEVMRRVGFDVT